MSGDALWLMVGALAVVIFALGLFFGTREEDSKKQ